MSLHVPQPPLDLIGLGMATLDILLRVESMPTWERPGPVEAAELDGGGPVGTACAAAARLGARVGFVGTVGSDELARRKTEYLHVYGVDTSRMVERTGPERQVVIVYIDAATGERTFSGLRGFGADPLAPEELDRDYLRRARYLHLDGFHHAAALAAARWVHEAGGRVCIDCGQTDARAIGDHTRELLALVDVLICGSGFGRAATGLEEPRAAGKALLALGPSIVVQTEGAEGSHTSARTGECFHTPAFPVEVVDTTGAGDVFHGAYLVGLLRGWDLPTVARFATAVAALECTRLGGRRGIPTFDETRAFLAARGLELPREGPPCR